MEIKRIELMPGVWLTCIQTRKFKTSCWALQLLTPLKKETAAMNALLPFVLDRGTARLADRESIKNELDELYGGQIEPSVAKKGDMQCIGFRGFFLDERFVPKGESLLNSAAQLMGELLLHPATRNGRLRQDYLNEEREEMRSRMEKRRADPEVYTDLRFVENMFSGSDYAIDAYGTFETLNRITPMRFFAQYQEILEHAPIELFYCGSASAEQMELVWREALMGLPRSQNRYLVATDSHRPPLEEVSIYREHAPFQKETMELGFRLGLGMSDMMFPAMLVVYAMFGGAPSAALQNDCEIKTLCTAITSRLYSLKGFLTVSCNGVAEQFSVLREKILHQVKRIQEEDFTREEFETAKQYVLQQISSVEDDPDRLYEQWLLDRAGGELFEVNRFYAQVQDVSESQVAAAAMEMILYGVCELSGRKDVPTE